MDTCNVCHVNTSRLPHHKHCYKKHADTGMDNRTMFLYVACGAMFIVFVGCYLCVLFG